MLHTSGDGSLGNDNWFHQLFHGEVKSLELLFRGHPPKRSFLYDNLFVTDSQLRGLRRMYNWGCGLTLDHPQQVNDILR
eukprot:3989357-Amphidinium_carterae.1